MAFSLFKQPLHLLVLGSALASTAFGALQCEDYGECEIVEALGVRFKQLKQYNTTISNARRSLFVRQDELSTVIGVGGDEIQETRTAGPNNPDEPRPDVFDRLFARAGEACFAGTCNPGQEIREGDYVIQMDGQYPEALRNGYIDMLHDAFFEAARDEVRTEDFKGPPPVGCPGCPPVNAGYVKYRTITGPGFMNAQRRDPANPGSDFMRARIIYDPQGVNCPPFVDAITAWGANVPKFAPIFGVISAICSSIGA